MLLIQYVLHHIYKVLDLLSGEGVSTSGNTGLALSVTANFIPYYLVKKHRREDTPV